MTLSKLRNVGIIAHVDAGKTTATERILFYTGKSHKAGDVHHGNTTTDFSPEERKRGITIYSAATTVFWRKHQLNIIDTPGHIDFNIEVNRSLRVLDGAVVLFDAVAGVEPQTETNWRLADKYEVPRVCFINKMDRLGADYIRTITMIKERLGANAAMLQLPIGSEDHFEGVVDLIAERALIWPDDNLEMASYQVTAIPEAFVEDAKHYRQALIEQLAEFDDGIMSAYLSEQPIDADALIEAVRRGTLKGQLVPTLCGSAFKNKGIEPLLNAMVDFLPSPNDRKPITGLSMDLDDEIERDHRVEEPLSALAFKVVSDKHGVLTFVRIYSGVLEPGMVALNTSTQQKERVGRLYEMHADKREPKATAKAGDIVAIVGLKATATGDTLCDVSAPIVLESISAPEPVIDIALELESHSAQAALIASLQGIVKEDPSLHLRQDNETGQLILSGMGELQLEVSLNRLRDEFDVAVKAGKPKVAYRETITRTASLRYRYKRQDGGPGQFAELELRLDPLERGAGFQFESTITGGVIPKEFIPSIEQGIMKAAESGVVEGYPLVDFKVTLLHGDYHEQDSSMVAFEKAASLAFKQIAASAKPIMLEPVMSVHVDTPIAYVGDCIGDLSKRRGLITEQIPGSTIAEIKAHVPLTNMFGYIGDLRAMTSGRANFTMQFARYEKVS